MPRNNNNEGLVQHLVSVRYRVVGSGNLQTRVLSLDESVNQTLAELEMNTETPKLPLAIANFRSQGMQIEFKISLLNETFTIGRIIVYIKPTATGNPV